MKVSIYKDEIGFVTNELSAVLAYESNLNEDNRIKFVTDLVAISRGKDESVNPLKCYQDLLKEATPYDRSQYGENNTSGSPSRPIEFIGIVLGFNFDCEAGCINITKTDGTFLNNNCVLELYVSEFINLIGKHGFLQNSKIYTNMRACLNAGIGYSDIPYNTAEELKDFKAVKARIPMFVFNRLITHTALSKEARSEHMLNIYNVDYWLPDDLRKRTYNTSYNEPHMIPNELQDIFHSVLSKTSKDGVVYDLIHKYSQHIIMQFFKHIGYPKEVYQRAMLEFQYKEMLLVGWYNDPKVWKHLFLEYNMEQDGCKNWIQEQTAVTVKAIKEVIESTTCY